MSLKIEVNMGNLLSAEQLATVLNPFQSLSLHKKKDGTKCIPSFNSHPEYRGRMTNSMS